MSNYANLKSAIQQVIKTNGRNEITGQLLQTELLAMINTLGYGYQYMGVANPNTVPGTPDAKVFYLAYTAGTYTNFGGIVVSGFCALKYDTTWTKEDIPISGGGGTQFTLQEDDLQFTGGQGLKLRFANRINGVNIESGLDYFILRDDISFEDQVTVGNTIYEIRYDFNLGNDNVQIPENCVLKFCGGSINGGSITLNKTYIDAQSFSCFKNVTLTGSFANQKIDVRIVNIYPNDSTFDTGNYIKTYLLGVDGVEWFFPAGNYYLSELYITKNNFAISGEPRFADNMTLPTIFRPFNSSQYYILKLGGKETALSPTNRVKAPKIYHIQFSCSNAFVPKSMTNEYGNTADYTSGLCVLDFVQVGNFAISGSSNYGDIPSILIGQIYECVFDYLLFYGGQGKSTCPRVQIVCSQSYSISATEIKLIMAESISGPIIGTSVGASIVELTIHQIFFEGVMIWVSGVTDPETYGTQYVDYAQYPCVPVFFLQGFITMRIDNISFSQLYYHWKNTLDADPNAVHYWSFIKSNLTYGHVNIGNIINAGGAETLFIDNVKSSPYSYVPKISIDKMVNCSIQQKTNKAGLIVMTDKTNDISNVGHTDRYAYLCPGHLYIGRELQELVMSSGAGGGKIVGGVRTLEKSLSHVINAAVSGTQGQDGGVLLNSKGFVIPTDAIYILTYRSSTTLKIRVSYQDIDGTELTTETISFTPVVNKINSWFIKFNKPTNCHHIVIYNQTYGYDLTIWGIMATSTAVYAKKSGSTSQRPDIANVEVGFQYFDTSLGKMIVSNGTNWVNFDGSSL